MMQSIELRLNPLWLLPCVVIALGFSLFLYFRKKAVWSAKVNTTLALVRFVGVLITLLLLLNPLLKRLKNTVQAPTIHFLIDDSKSLDVLSERQKSDLQKKIIDLKTLTSVKANVEIYGLENEIKHLDSLSFKTPITNISTALKELSEQNAGENHVATVLFSDGIVNQGVGLSNIITRKPIFSVALGDTTEKKDISVSELFLNTSTYKGNQFPIQAAILAKGYKKQEVNIQFIVDSKLIETKKVNVSSNKELIDVNFKYSSDKIGYRKIKINIEKQTGEFAIENNSKTAYILVKDSRKKIAIISQSPHPDIKAIKLALSTLDKYQVAVFHLSFNPKLPDIKDFDAFILHQLPCARCINKQFATEILKSKKPRWILSGAQSDLYQYGKYIESVALTNLNGTDEVIPVLNKNFDLFRVEEFNFDWLQFAAPLKVPFAQITPKHDAHVLFEQRVGSISNGKPIITFSNKRKKELLFLGDGLWKWRMFEQLESNKSANFDLLISKLVGLLDPADKGDQFLVKPQKNNYVVSENPVFSVTIKNDLGELIYKNPIDFQVFKEDSVVFSSSFKVSSFDPFYKLSGLPEGVYSYTATTRIASKKVKDFGTFSVSDLQLEAKNLQADFAALKSLAKKNGGDFYQLDKLDIQKLSLDLTKFPSKINSHIDQKPIIDLFYPLLVILILFSIEWITRKLLGDI